LFMVITSWGERISWKIQRKDQMLDGEIGSDPYW
jgi:hypothetical protein